MEMAGGSSFLFHPFLGSFCVTACVTQSERNNGKPIFILRPLFSRKNGTGTQQGRRGFSFSQYVKVADIWLRFWRIYFALVRIWVYVVGEVRGSKTEMGASFCGGFPSPIKQRGRSVGGSRNGTAPSLDGMGGMGRGWVTSLFFPCTLQWARET